MESSRLARTAVAAAGLFAVLAGLAVTSPSAGAGAPQDSPREVPQDDPARGQVYAGLAPGQPGTPCERSFEIRGDKQQVLGCTHGPDAGPPGVDVRDGHSDAQIAADIAEGQAASLEPDEAAADGYNATGIACVGDGTSGYRVQAIYAVPSDRPNRSAEVVAAIRAAYAPEVESRYYRSAVETGGEVHVPFVTTPTGDGSCELDVRVEVLTSAGDDSFSNTVSQLKARGYDSSNRKYMVWMDSNVFCGIGSIYGDDRPTQDNLNNGYAAMFGRSDSGCWGYAEAHELMHNLGGVQLGAPNATNGYHCKDEPDEMCYDDDGAGPTVMRVVCTGRDGTLFDCNHDDYFLAGTPPSGTWLATHWNTYDSRFLHRGLLGPPPPTNAAPTVSAGPDGTATTAQEITLDGTASDDGLPAGSTLTVTWSKATGPGTVTFGSPDDEDTTASFSSAGTYTVRLTATDGTLTSFDSATVVVSDPGPTNAAPTVSAGPGGTATTAQEITLDGTASDDGLPVGSTLTVTWSQASGPGTVIFGSPDAENTTATFSAAGTYTVRLSATDGALTTSDLATVTVSAPSPVTESFTGTLSSTTKSITHGFTSGRGTVSATIQVTGTSRVTATLYDGSGRRIAGRSGTGSFTISGSNRTAGAHRLVMTGSSGSYTATVTHPA
jgi:PKD repeat protein